MKYTFQDVDERIIKTRFALTGAIVNLIKRENKIKVLDICREAHITPMTYYHHFNNKTDLLEYTVRKQLENILPIPKKLKPISLKHLVFYLINAFSKFICQNRNLIYLSLQRSKFQGYINSYLYLVFIHCKDLIKQEVRLLCKQDLTYVELWNDVICGSLFNVFTHMVVNKQFINENIVWKSYKHLVLNLN